MKASSEGSVATTEGAVDRVEVDDDDCGKGAQGREPSSGGESSTAGAGWDEQAIVAVARSAM